MNDERIKTYVAGRYTGRDRILKEASTIQGIEIVSTWLTAEEQDYPYAEDDARGYAEKDIDELSQCDLFILDTFDESNHGGREVELGYALAIGMEIMLIGPRRNVFHYLGCIDHYESWDELREGWND